jgi:hypothetical protein
MAYSPLSGITTVVFSDACQPEILGLLVYRLSKANIHQKIIISGARIEVMSGSEIASHRHKT